MQEEKKFADADDEKTKREMWKTKTHIDKSTVEKIETMQKLRKTLTENQVIKIN